MTQQQATADRVTAYIGLGSNLADPLVQIEEARRALADLPETNALAFSRLYRSSPMGPADQPDYVNAVMALQTALEPHELLSMLQAIEVDQGRVRNGLRWGPRTLDLDLLLYGNRVINTPDLTVPHPGVAVRSFVLYPLNDIAPDLVLPAGLGKVSSLVAGCPDDDLAPIA